MKNSDLKKPENKVEFIDFISDPVIVIEKKSLNIEYLNNEAEVLFKSSRDSSVGKHVSIFFEKTSPTYDYIVNSNKRYGTFIYNELKLNNSDFLFNLEIINSEEINSMILCFKSEKFLNKNNEELNSIHSLIDEVVSKVCEKIKNPITSIRGSTQIIKKNLNNKDQEFFEIILTECNKVIDFINLFEPEYTGVVIDKKKENIHELIRVSIKNLKPERNNNIEIIEEFDPSLPEIQIKKKKIIQVITSLLRNSIESIGLNQGFIRIKTNYTLGAIRKLPNIKKKEPKNHISISIEDNGTGIDKKNFRNIFIPFFSTKSDNHGVSLYLAKKTVDEHNGSIEFLSETSGSKFIIHLPV